MSQAHAHPQPTRRYHGPRQHECRVQPGRPMELVPLSCAKYRVAPDELPPARRAHERHAGKTLA